MAIMVSTYEDFDVTHTRPNPGTLRLPTTTTTNNGNTLNFLGAATKGMGWGPSNRGDNFFEDWYGSSATTLQWKPSYNEIMLQHRRERVPRWTELLNNDERDGRSVNTFGASLPSSASSQGTNIGVVTESSPTSATTTKEQLQQAVLQLYNSLNELDELKLMADDYMWDEMKELMKPTSNIIITMGSTSSTTTSSAEDAAVGGTSGRNNNEYSLPKALEYSMDVLKTMPTYYASTTTSSITTSTSSSSSNTVDSSSSYMKEIPEIIGFDWGSCAWRHCGAKADAQEAIAELYNSVGMLEPYECRFIIGK